MSAAPSSVSDDATILDWPSEPGGEMPVLRQGSSDWACLPDFPETPGNDPMCLDGPWMEWLDAFMNQGEPEIAKMGIGYMLQGGSPNSNTDPFAEGPTPDNEWMTESVPYLMVIVPDERVLEGMPTDPNNGGPWVMWRDTPLVHVVVPTPPYEPAE